MLGALIGAGASLLGGLLGRDSQRDAEKRNYANQKEFAQNTVQWRVADAQKAGVHPLYALGATPMSFSPVSVGGDPLAQGIANAGQDISRAVSATSAVDEKAKAYASAVQALQLQRMGLENNLLASQIAKINQAGVMPPAPDPAVRYLVDGQTSSGPVGLVETERMRRVAGAPEALWQEPGAITDVGYARTVGGGYAPVPSKDMKERIEDDLIGELLWSFRNRILPSVGVNQSPPPAPVPEGYDAWLYNPFWQEYRPHRESWIPGVYY